MNFSIVYSTTRYKPEFQWLMDSVRRESDCPIIVIHLQTLGIQPSEGVTFRNPKPNVWQGAHRVTKDSWWAKSNSLNSGICLCQTEWLVCVDDRSVLLPGWRVAIEAAMAGGYAVCGSYEKRHNLAVENGVITDWGTLDGSDPRSPKGKDHRADMAPTVSPAPGSWWFGCVNALPLEWALQVNGYEEMMDGLSMEDCIFGLMLQNNGFPIKYDPRLKLIEDRTPGKCGPVLRRTSKERFPNDKEDKGHAALARFGSQKRTQHHWDLRAIRAAALRGEPFPHHNGQPEKDWFDAMPIQDFDKIP